MINKAGRQRGAAATEGDTWAVKGLHRRSSSIRPRFSQSRTLDSWSLVTHMKDLWLLRATIPPIGIGNCMTNKKATSLLMRRTNLMGHASMIVV